MIVKNDMAKLKKSLEDIVGQEIRLISRNGHRKDEIRQGRIEKIYPSIFAVRLKSSESSFDNGRLVTFSYTDVLTKSIEVALCRKAE